MAKAQPSANMFDDSVQFVGNIFVLVGIFAEYEMHLKGYMND